MRILVSCVPFDHGRSGISVYMRHAVAALAATGHQITLVVEAEAADEPAFAPFEKIIAPRWTRRAVFSMLWHLFILPFRISRRQFDLFYICAANRREIAFRPVPTVAVVHDLAAHRVRGKYDRFRMFYQTRVLPFFIRRCEYPVAISEATAADMAEFMDLPREKITVSWDGLSLPNVPPADGWLERNGLKKDSYILYISRLEHPAKNQFRLIEAYEKLPPELSSRFRLVLGGADWHGAEVIRAKAADSPLAGRILLAGFIADADLEQAYRNAAAYVFPSLFEGFGLSLIEAMHYGVPCCCSSGSSLGEIGRGAALLFDPLDPDAIAAALTRLLSEPELRAKLIEAGRVRAGEFTWKNHVERILHAVSESGK
ncbi:MAG: glycosyltransferase family 4 protein [Lentisphaeria bacterium]|nr:glycosyltransferase family 4 protein [Lentisphaeria bacterium]